MPATARGAGALYHRLATAAQWTSDNPVLGLDEFGFESDTGKYKLGDGTTHWASLSYGGGSGGGLSEPVTLAQILTANAGILASEITLSPGGDIVLVSDDDEVTHAQATLHIQGSGGGFDGTSVLIVKSPGGVGSLERVRIESEQGLVVKGGVLFNDAGADGYPTPGKTSVHAAVAATGATNASPYGYAQAQANDIVTLLNEIRAALIAVGLLQ